MIIEAAPDSFEEVHGFDITSPMKADVLGRGQPLFRLAKGKGKIQPINIKRAFPTARITIRNGNYIVRLPNGMNITIYLS